MSVERSDVDISRLFMWGKEFIIEGNGGEELKTYIRLVGDADLNRARVYALRSSADLRKKLKTPNSDERLAYVPEAVTVDKEVLISVIASMSLREFAQEAVKEVDIPYPTEPKSDDPLEKHEKYQKLVDEYPAKREKALEKVVTKKAENKKTELSILSTDRLFELYEGNIITELCENEMMAKFKEYITYSGIYLDMKYTQKMFNSIEEFQNLPTEVKDKFLTAYQELEIEQDTLKK